MTDTLTFDSTILAASGQRFLRQLGLASIAVLVIGGVAAWNKARVLAVGIVQLDRVLSPIVLRHGTLPAIDVEKQVGGNGNSVYAPSRF
jgi:hypothetical protein